MLRTRRELGGILGKLVSQGFSKVDSRSARDRSWFSANFSPPWLLSLVSAETRAAALRARGMPRAFYFQEARAPCSPLELALQPPSSNTPRRSVIITFCELETRRPKSSTNPLDFGLLPHLPPPSTTETCAPRLTLNNKDHFPANIT